jgi:hypothetical protein
VDYKILIDEEKDALPDDIDERFGYLCNLINYDNLKSEFIERLKSFNLSEYESEDCFKRLLNLAIFYYKAHQKKPMAFVYLPSKLYL